MPRGGQEHRRHCCLKWWLPASRPNTTEPNHVGGCQEWHYRKLSWPGWGQVVEANHRQTKAEALRWTQNAIRFHEVVEQTFTEENQTVDIIQERLTSQCINGLRNKAIRRHICLGLPKTLKDAMTLAITAAGAFEMADTERTEEPMEVGALEMGPPPVAPSCGSAAVSRGHGQHWSPMPEGDGH